MEVRLLGAMEVAGEGGTPLPVQGAKLRALLAMLALDGGRVVATDTLIDGLWQDDPPAGVANSLQRLVSKLRKSLGDPDLVAMRPPGYVLAIEPEDVDVHRLDRLVAEARSLVEQGDLERAVARFADAEALWRGPALADFTYEEFAQPHLARLQEVRLSLIEDRVDAELALARHQRLVADLEVLVADHPVRERLRGQLMVALYRSGRQADALQVFQDGRTVLAEELGLDPGPDLRELETAILNQDPALSAPPGAAPATTAGRDRRRTNVKPFLTPLVGRSAELAEVAALLAEHRLVTLAGPGGAGKTRLALETAERAVANGDGDVMVVELAAVGDRDAVAETIASTFELPDPGVEPLARVQELCDGREVIVVLDNCEHLVAEAAAVTGTLLEANPGMRVLATSREALRVPGEAVWVVPPLEPTDAVGLFVQRATAADSRFEVDDDARAVVEDVCARLDGLPLAIELAAARTRAFTVGQIAERLDDRFRLLSGGSRTAMARQQTLRAVVDWSYDLLFEDERRVFERISVFPGGCTIAAAEIVCADDDLTGADVVESIAGLVDKSLLVVDRSGSEARYGMLQTLCQYGRERLVERGEADAAFGRMAAYMAALCEGGRQAIRGIDQREWFNAVGAEHDNLRTAFEWAVGAEEKALAVALGADLAFDRWIAGGVDEGHRWLDVALALPGDLEPFLDGWARMWHVFLGFMTGHREDLDERFDAAITLLREHADPVFAGYALAFQFQLVAAMGQRARGVELIHATIDELRRSDDAWAGAAIPWAEAVLAVQAHDDFAAFEAGMHDAAEGYRAVGDQFMTAVCRDLLAELAETRGDLDDVTDHLTAALDIVTGWRMRSFEAALRSRLGRAAVQRQDDDAEALVLEALGRSDDVVFRPGRAMSLASLANLQRRQGRLDEAEAAASESAELYRNAPALRFSSSFSRAPTHFDVPVGLASALSVLGFVAEARGEAGAAIEHHRAAYEAVAATAHPRAIPLALEGLAAAVLLAGDAEQAGQLLGCSTAMRAASGAVGSPAEHADVDRVRAAAIAQIGPAAFAAAAADGARTDADRLVSAIQRP